MLIFQPLELSHDRKSFDCGVVVLNDFLQKTARQHREKGISNTFVLVDEVLPEVILGYFTLTFLEVDVCCLPDGYAQKLPKSSRLPAAKLARLAVASSCQSKGYGALILADAVRRIVLSINLSGAITGLFVDAKDEKVQQFYLHFGFIPLQNEPLKLFLPLKTLIKARLKAELE